MCGQRILQTGRRCAEQAFAALLPHELPGSGERLVVEHVDRHDRHVRPIRPGEFAHPGRPVTGAQLEHVDEFDAARGLRREVAGEVGLGHRRDRVTRHGRVAVEPVAHTVCRREQVAEQLVAAQARRADDHRRPRAAHQRNADVDGTADRAGGGRRVEGGADLVMQDRRVQRGQARERRWQLARHPLRAAAARLARQADAGQLGKARQPRRSGRAQEQHGRHTGGGEGFHCVGGTDEVVTVVGEQQAVGPGWRCWRCGRYWSCLLCLRCLR